MIDAVEMEEKSKLFQPARSLVTVFLFLVQSIGEHAFFSFFG